MKWCLLIYLQANCTGSFCSCQRGEDAEWLSAGGESRESKLQELTDERNAIRSRFHAISYLGRRFSLGRRHDPFYNDGNSGAVPVVRFGLFRLCAIMPASPAVALVTEVPHLVPRPLDANKGMFGRVLVVAGSRGMSGAAVLCASAVLRGGAGLVRLAVPSSLWPIVAVANPCYMTLPLPEDGSGRLTGAALADLLEAVRQSQAAAVGPGLGQSSDLALLVRNVVDQTATPLVLDADALNALAGQLEHLRRRGRPTVLTPHPGEFARLIGKSIADVQAARQELAVHFAAELGVVLVLKGQGTVVTDGRRAFINPTGNPGMATGGTGDVLAGLIAALIGHGLETFAAAQLGVYLHGLAGDLARDALGETSLIASDLLDYLPPAFQAHAQGRPQT